MPDLSQFQKQWYLNLETFRQDGRGVRTPLWFVEKDGVLYMRTPMDTWKVKRIRRNAAVRVAPSNFQGAAKGVWLDGVAEIMPAAQAPWVNQAFRQKYGLLKRLIDLRNRRRGYGDSYFAVIAVRCL